RGDVGRYCTSQTTVNHPRIGMGTCDPRGLSLAIPCSIPLARLHPLLRRLRLSQVCLVVNPTVASHGYSSGRGIVHRMRLHHIPGPLIVVHIVQSSVLTILRRDGIRTLAHFQTLLVKSRL